LIFRVWHLLVSLTLSMVLFSFLMVVLSLVSLIVSFLCAVEVFVRANSAASWGWGGDGEDRFLGLPGG